MKIKNPMLVVTDINKSLEFYIKVLGLHVIMDFGANKTLTGGWHCKHLKLGMNLLVQTTFHSVVIVLKYILKRITLTNLLID